MDVVNLNAIADAAEDERRLLDGESFVRGLERLFDLDLRVDVVLPGGDSQHVLLAVFELGLLFDQSFVRVFFATALVYVFQYLP